MRLCRTEKKFFKKDIIFCGTDEAGRGALAGPVVAASYIPDFSMPLVSGVKDSKKLSPKFREYIFAKLISRGRFTLGIIEHSEIDSINIHKASLKAMQNSILSLDNLELAFVDGKYCPDIPLECRAVIKGDSSFYTIAAASIIAKVSRDALMRDYDKIFPGYDFFQHKGYPTKKHKAALKKLGPCSIHRLSYAPVKEIVDEVSV